MKVILDTSFILTCLKENLDFLLAKDFGDLILPLQVIDELRKIQEKAEPKDRKLAKLALEIIQENKPEFEIIKLDKKYVDAGIVDYIRNNKGVIVATIDAGLKKKIKDKVEILVIRARNKLALI